MKGKRKRKMKGEKDEGRISKGGGNVAVRSMIIVSGKEVGEEAVTIIDFTQTDSQTHRRTHRQTDRRAWTGIMSGDEYLCVTP